MITTPEQLAAALGEADTSPVHREDWNAYVDHLDKMGLKGSPKLDKNNLGNNLLADYIKNNPSTSLTPNSHFHVQNDMSSQTSETSVIDGLHSNATKNKFAPGDPEETEIQRFGNWTGQRDTKVMAADLKKRGLVGADQLLEDTVDTSSGDKIRNAQSDWKVAAIQNILSNARKRNLHSPEEINANRDVLIDNPKWRDAINNSSFKVIHPNFWDVITKSILPEQYKKYDSKKDIAKK